VINATDNAPLAVLISVAPRHERVDDRIADPLLLEEIHALLLL